MASNVLRNAISVALLGTVLLLAGCARPVGDFGRAAPDPLHDTVMPAVGQMRAAAAGEPASAFNLTDQEREMRDRIWRYLISPRAFDWFGDIAIEWQRTRIAPPPRKAMPADNYYRWLRGQDFASSRVRYTRVSDDVAADLGMLPSAFRAICAVEEVDRQRLVAANGIGGLEPAVLDNAAARRAENDTVIGWFVRALGNRYDSYSYALDHLLVETPHEEAVRLDGMLSDLAAYVGAGEALDFCSAVGGGQTHSGQTGLHSRYLHSDPDAGLPPK